MIYYYSSLTIKALFRFSHRRFVKAYWNLLIRVILTGRSVLWGLTIPHSGVILICSIALGVVMWVLLLSWYLVQKLSPKKNVFWANRTMVHPFSYRLSGLASWYIESSFSTLSDQDNSTWAFLVWVLLWQQKLAKKVNPKGIAIMFSGLTVAKRNWVPDRNLFRATV